MKEKLVLAGIATALVLGIGSVSASAAPLGGTLNQAQPQQGLLLKAHYDDYAPWWRRHRHHHRFDDYGYRGRPWWWKKFYRDHDRRAERRDYRDDRRDHRRNRDW